MVGFIPIRDGAIEIFVSKPVRARPFRAASAIWSELPIAGGWTLAAYPLPARRTLVEKNFTHAHFLKKPGDWLIDTAR